VASIVEAVLERSQGTVRKSKPGDAKPGRKGRSPKHCETPDAECADDEGDMDEAGSSGDMGEIGHPQRIRPRRPELPIDLVLRARGRIVAHRRLQAHAAHQPLRRATRHALSLPGQLPPGLARAVDREILGE
jgi:hypothetical protein